MPNDTATYERLIRQHEGVRPEARFTFPYVIDETQEVASAYAAECTPDFFGFNAQDELQYRGRLDAARMQPVANTRRDLFEAMKQIGDTGHGPGAQRPQWVVRSSGKIEGAEPISGLMCVLESGRVRRHKSV